jgi:tartrate dehydratase alpha subunit/fumarate hydratase class I-like protein
MDELLEEDLNEVGIGPQGLTGNNSVMGVNIESSARHPSTIGVAVSTDCWAHRRGRVREFGPLIISIDTKGNNLIEQNKAYFDEKKKPAIDRIKSQVRFIK